MKCITYCAVNCFAIITGYVNFSQEPKKFYYSKFLRLWSQVVTYSFGIQLIAFLFGRQRGIGRLLFSAFPILSGQYWFVCCYAGLFLLMPWLNKFLRTIDTKESIRFSTLLFLFFSCFGTVAAYFGDPFAVNEGFSVFWLMVLYIVGSTLKKLSLERTMYTKCRHLVVAIVLCTLSMWVLGLLVPRIENLVVMYNSPFEVILAICYFLLFKKITITGEKIKKWIVCLSGSSFSVYLIHMQGYIKTEILENDFIWISGFSAWFIPVIVIGSALAIFTSCLFIDKLRRFLFKTLYIEHVIRKVEMFFSKLQDSVDRNFYRLFSR